MKLGYSEHRRRKPIFHEIYFFLWYLVRYIKVSIHNHADNEGYGIEIIELAEDHPILMNSSKIFEINKTYYDGPIWTIRLGFMMFWARL